MDPSLNLTHLIKLALRVLERICLELPKVRILKSNRIIGYLESDGSRKQRKIKAEELATLRHRALFKHFISVVVTLILDFSKYV